MQHYALKYLLIILSVFFTAQFSSAKVFKNAYVSFELPETWNCKLEHTEWVCRSEVAKEAKEATIILTAKEIGPVDTLDQYASYLSKPIPTSYKSAGATASKVQIPPQKNKYNDHLWVDSLHLGSEISSYFTRYAATTKDKIAVLVTFSAHKLSYTKYSQDFSRAINSLRVIANPNLLARPDIGPIRPGSETLGAPIAGAMQDLADADAAGEGEGDGSSSSGGKTKTLFLVIALALGGAGIYLFLKSRRS